jgi:hypothetical protein
MQRQAKLDDAEIGREMRTAATHQIAQHVAHLLGEPFKLR